ncbi:MAG: TonB-dependent receptor [Flavobacteriaceae bacterium]
MKNILVLGLWLGTIITSIAQTITVKDIETNLPLEGVVFLSEKPKVSLITNAQGQADITAFKKAKIIQIRSLGFKTLFKSFDEIENDNFILFLEPMSMDLDEVVISATRWRQTTGNIPSKVISVSPKEIILQNPQTAADLLGVSGKVFVQKSQQGGGSPMIRGFATNRLLYTVDGVRMNTAIFRGGNLQNVISLDPFATENTEVLFGPGSVIYGSDAIGGVMSFQTLTPQLSLNDKTLLTGKAVTRYSSANNEKTGHLDVNIGWKKWALVTSFSSWDYDHLKQGSHGPNNYIKDYHVERQNGEDVVISQNDPLFQVPTAYSQINVMQKVRFVPNKNWDLQYGFHYSETSPYGRYDRHNRTRNGLPRYAEWNYGPQKWMMNNLSFHHTKSNTVYDQVTLRLALQAFKESRIDRSLNSTERNTQLEKVNAYSINLDMVKSIHSKNTLYYGLEYILNDVDSKGKLTDIIDRTSIVGPSRYPMATWSSLAAYINNEFRASEKFTLQGGLRYNQYILDADFENNLDFYPLPFNKATINDGALTGSIGGVYKPTNSWAIRANVGTAFRSPNVDDIGKIFDSEPGAVTVPNPDLKAEYAYNFDLGIAKIFKNTVKIDLTGYYTILKNALVRRDFLVNGQDSIMYDGILSKVQAIQNAASAHVYGLQAGVEVKLSTGFNFSSDINYQYGEEELDDGSTSPSRHASPLFGVSRLTYRSDKLKLEAYTTFQGERSFEDLALEEQSKDEIYAKDANGNNYSPSWYTLNVKAMYNLSDMFSISSGIENITDQRYRPYSSGISGAGRNFILSLKAEF